MSRLLHSDVVQNAAPPATAAQVAVTEVPDKIWVEDVAHFAAQWQQFWPNKRQSLTNKINACVRLLLYIGVALSLSKRDKSPIIMASLMIALLTTLYYMGNLKQREYYDDDPVPVPGRRRRYLRPTPDNPMGNRVPLDGTEALKYEHVPYSFLSKDANDAFTKRLYMNYDDAWSTQNSQRQFTKMPEQDIGKFAEYAYGGNSRPSLIRDCLNRQR